MGSNATTANHAAKYSHHAVPGAVYTDCDPAIDLVAADPRGLGRCASLLLVYVTTSAKVLSVYPPGDKDVVTFTLPVGFHILPIQVSGLGVSTTVDAVTACYPPG